MCLTRTKGSALCGQINLIVGLGVHNKLFSSMRGYPYLAVHVNQAASFACSTMVHVYMHI